MMDFYKPRHEYALTENGNKIFPDKAEYNVNYYDSRKNELILKAKDSKYKRTHFSYKPDIDFLNISESNTVHTEAINYIKNKGFVIINNIKYLPHKIVIEKATIEDTRLIPDLTFYDKNDNILCLVEVACTHKCEPEKIKILEDKNILTLELDYDNDYKNFTGYREFGFKPDAREVNEIERNTENVRNSNRRNRGRIQEGESFIKTIKFRKRNGNILGFQNFNERQTKQFDDIKKRIKFIKTNVEEIQLKIQEGEHFLQFTDVEKRVRNAKYRIQEIESNPFYYYE